MNSIVSSSTSNLPAEWQMLQQQAAALVASGFLPQAVNTPQKAVAIMLLGRELGIQAWAALTSINVIQGKPTVSPQLMLALINRSGQLEDIVIESDETLCTVTMKRKGQTPHAELFSLDMAKAMGLHNKDNYKKQPAVMLKWRAVAACARVVFADVILGLYTPEEMGAEVIADEQGNMTVIDAELESARNPVTEPLQFPASASQQQRPPQSSSAPQIAPEPHGDPFVEAFGAPSPTPASGDGGSGDALVTAESLWQAANGWFNARPHFDAHWLKHQSEYTNMSLAEAVRFVTQLHWNYDKAKCADLEALALNVYAMERKDVLEALTTANGHSVKKYRDWDGGNWTVAQGALLAWKSGYDRGNIEFFAKANSIADGVHFTADEISVQFQRASALGGLQS